jgi:flagellar basal body P-ring protein FlgI
MMVLNLLRDDYKVALKIHRQIKKVREKEINEEKVGQSYRARLLRDDYKVALKIHRQIKKVREKEINEEKVGQSYRARLSSILSFWVNFCLEQLVKCILVG